MTTDFVLDLNELKLISITKSLVELENLMTELKTAYIQNKVQCKDK